MESFGLVCAVQQDRMLANTRSAEVVTETADCDDQRVVGEETLPHHFPSLVVEIRGEHDLALVAVEPDQFPDTIVEVVPMGLSPEFRLLHLKFHASRRDVMQQRFPEVSPRLVDQRHISDAAPTERVAKACDQLKATGTAADDDDAMRGAVAACHINYHLTASITGRSANLFPSRATPEQEAVMAQWLESEKLPMLCRLAEVARVRITDEGRKAIETQSASS